MEHKNRLYKNKAKETQQTKTKRVYIWYKNIVFVGHVPRIYVLSTSLMHSWTEHRPFPSSLLGSCRDMRQTSVYYFFWMKTGKKLFVSKIPVTSNTSRSFLSFCGSSWCQSVSLFFLLSHLQSRSTQVKISDPRPCFFFFLPIFFNDTPTSILVKYG